MLNLVYKSLVKTKDDLFAIKPVDHEARWVDRLSEMWVYSTERGWESLTAHVTADNEGPIGAADRILNGLVKLIEDARAFHSLLKATERGHIWASNLEKDLMRALSGAAPYGYKKIKGRQAESALHDALCKCVKEGE